MIYKGEYYSALNGGRICSDGNWYPNNIVYKDYYNGEWISSEQNGVIFLEDVCEYANLNSDKFEGFRCIDCGEYYANDWNVVFTEDTVQSYCEDCAERELYHCQDCGEWYEREENIYRDSAGHELCNDCYEEGHTICEDCGEFVDFDHAVHIDEEIYCENCADERMANQIIKPYHTNMDYTPLTLKTLDNYYISNLKLFGFEVEVECDTDLAERVMELLGDVATLQKDSSVDGFEIITKPMTQEFFYQVFIDKLEPVLKYLRDKGAKGHNCGGIHIHFSKNNISTSLGNSNLHKLMYIPEKNGDSTEYKILRGLSQRTVEDLEHWASLSGTATRYSAIHYDDRTDTYEMRIFNSNLRIERIIKNFEVLLSMIEYSETFGGDCMNMKYYLQWVMQTQGRYECLKCFIKEKNILNIIDFNYSSDNWFFDLFSRPAVINKNITEEQTTCVS